jgi:sugar/nucleoside kinase (ribokinase family)
MKRLGVLGTLVWDRIWHPARSGAAVEQWGGITYSLHALSAACPPDWTVEPLLKIGHDLAEEARTSLTQLPNVSLDAGFTPVPEPTNRVELTYSDEAQRGERLTGGVPSWTWAEIEPLLSRYDALYVNFISGFELELETALAVRAAFPGPIYADLHSLFLGCPGSGTRRRRALPRWREWITCFDAIQLNEAELELLAESTEPAVFMAELSDAGPELIAATFGDRGVRIEARRGRLHAVSAGERLSLQVPIDGSPVAGDPTGCGDVWGSTFYMGLLAGFAPEAAARRANGFAAANIRSPGTDGLHTRLRAVDRTAGTG